LYHAIHAIPSHVGSIAVPYLPKSLINPIGIRQVVNTEVRRGKGKVVYLCHASHAGSIVVHLPKINSSSGIGRMVGARYGNTSVKVGLCHPMPSIQNRGNKGSYEKVLVESIR